jgi:hypothetical protein
VGNKTQRTFSQQVGVEPLGSSRRTQRALVDFGSDEAFAPAAAKFHEHYGIEISVNRVRAVTLAHAQKIAESQPAPLRSFPAKGVQTIVAEADGSMVPIVDTGGAPVGADLRKHRKVSYRELKLVAARTLGEGQTYYGATLHDVSEAGDLWENVVRRAGRGLATHVHGVGDGAVWIGQQFTSRFGPGGTYLLDLFHVCDYLSAVYAGDKAMINARRDLLKEGKVEAVLGGLADRLEPLEIPDESAPARCALRYLQNRPGQLDYPAAILAGLPIGSGLIESGNRHVIQRRLKQAGAWWTAPNAHAMAQLRALRANGGFKNYWSQN